MAARDGRKLTIQVVGDVKNIQKDVAQVNKTIGGLGKAAKGMAVGLAAAFTLDKVVDFAKGAIDAASDLNESMSKVGVVFDDSADAIVAWSRTSATAMGLSQQKALEAAGTFGNLFDALKLSEEATVDMSKGAVQLAADLASFNNVPIEDTLLAIRSGLLGEAEPMRKFGSALSAARVQAYGVANGLANAKGVMTEAQKVQARYRLILEDTANASGDFARTSDGLANSQRILDANIQNLMATLGSALVGPMADVTNWLNLLITGPSGGKLQEAADKWRDLNTTIAETKPPAQGDWLLGGTVFDSLVDGLNGVNDALLDFLIPQSTWVEKFQVLGETAGFTRDEMLYLAKVIKDGGGTIDDFAKVLERAAIDKKVGDMAKATTSYLDGWNAAWTATADTVTTTAPPAVKAAVKQVERSLSDLIGITRTTLKDTRAEVRDRMRDIRDALEHPFRDDSLESTYRNAVKRGTKAMNKALREGNEEAYAEASSFVADYKAKLRELRLQRFRVRVSMFIDDSGVTGPGATLLGGAAGAAWGTARGRRARPRKHATGLDYVPFDNYPALLHKGERVMTAAENRGSGAVHVSITVNAPVASDGYRVGQQIAGYLDQWASRGGSFRHLPMGAR